MENYHKLIAESKIVASELHYEKRRLHDELIAKRQFWFRCLDILFASIILMNFFAVVITNVMVTKKYQEEGAEIQYTEVNPNHAQANNLQLHSDYINILKAVLIQSIWWFLMIFCYVYYRFMIFTEKHLILMVTVVIWYVSVVGWDLFNDFGLLIGNLI